MELLILVIVFFVVALAAAWLLLFPTGRDAVVGAAGRSSSRTASRLNRLARMSAGAAGHTSHGVHRAAAGFARFLLRHRYVTIAALLLTSVPPLLITQMHQHVVLDGYNTQTDYSDSALISSLLRGERLAPPAALPPAMFRTREVELVRPQLATANRKWTLLKPDFRQRLLVIYKLMREKYGYNMHLLEGYRSPKRQQTLDDSGSGVTHAGAYRSYHQFGLAADSAFVRDGKLVISAKSAWAMRGYRLYGKLAKAVGLTWGGNWTMRDYGHVELRRTGVLGHPSKAIHPDVTGNDT